MIRRLMAASLMALVTGAVLAQNLDVIKERQDTMKRAEDASADPFKMIKGQEPFDLAKVMAALQVYVEVAKKMPTLFPDDSKTGGKTEALPIIWDHKDDLTARYAKLGSDATAAMTEIKDPASLKTVFLGVFKNCSDCHETYRAKQN